jgi:branched-chain amino acid transport system permease protein
MAIRDLKKLFFYSLFLGILILPMVGLPTTTFHAAKALSVWGIFAGILALGMVNKTLSRTGSYQRAAGKLAPLWEPTLGSLGRVSTKNYVAILLACAAVYPMVVSRYMMDVGITCLIYVVLGLGLNIVVGLAGLLDLGYIAFYAVGAYTYSLLNLHFGLSFWLCLPAGILLEQLG